MKNIKLSNYFKDKNEKVVLGETPNLPIIVWIICLVLQKITEGNLQTLFEVVGFGALFTWAWLEIFQGTNYFRRTLGFIVMFVTLYSRIY